MGTVNQNKQFIRNCINALAHTDWQVIISMGTDTDHFSELPENIQVYESVDQMVNRTQMMVRNLAEKFATKTVVIISH